MAEALMEMKTGFAPYADGSGFALSVEVRQEDESSAPTITIENCWRVDIVHWPTIRDGVERMIAALPKAKESALLRGNQEIRE